MLQSFINRGLTQEELESETLIQVVAGSDVSASDDDRGSSANVLDVGNRFQDGVSTAVGMPTSSYIPY